MARARRAARRDRGRGQDARAAPHRVPRVRARPGDGGCTPTCASRCGARPTLEGLARDDDWAAGGDVAAADAAPASLPRAGARRARPSARCSTACSPARRSASTRSSRCSARAVPSSPEVAAVADQLRRDIVGDDVTFVRNRNINYTNVCTFKCRFCAFSKGPLSLNLRGDPYLLDLEEIQRRVVEAVELRRHRGVPPGRHPPRLRRRLLPRRRAGGEGGRARRSTCTASPRSRSPRARAASACRCATTSRSPKEAGLATLPGTAAEILDDEVRAVICPDKVEHRGVARGAPHRALGRAALERHDHVRHVERPDARRPPPRAHPRRCRRRPAGSPSSCRCRSCTWRRRSSCSGRRRTGPTFREVLLMHAVGRIAYRGWIDNIQVSWVKSGHRRRAPGAAGRLQRPRRHADGREHLARRGREPRPGARRGRASARSSSRSAARSSSAPRSTGAPRTVGRRLRPPPEALDADRVAVVPVRRRARRLPVA